MAAPLLVGPQVVGVIHADRGRGQPLDVLDRDVLWEFATGLAHAYEGASLRRTLHRERDEMRGFLDWLGARSSELTDAPVTLGTDLRFLGAVGGRRGPAPSAARRCQDRTALEGLLTRRELDVLALLAQGASNNAIAAALVISDGTVKFHVNSILRKLHVANRARRPSPAICIYSACAEAMIGRAGLRLRNPDGLRRIGCLAGAGLRPPQSRRFLRMACLGCLDCGNLRTMKGWDDGQCDPDSVRRRGIPGS